VPARLSEAELAERSARPPELVRRLVELGILRPGEDGTFTAGDVALVRVVASFEDSGIALEDIAAGVVSGDLDFGGVGTYFTEQAPSSGTWGELASRLERSQELVGRIVGALGLPQPGPDDPVREDEADILAGLLHAWEILDEEELVRLARFQGETARRAAAANIRFFDEHVRQRVLRADGEWAEGGRVVEETATRAIRFARIANDWLYVRHFERALVQYMAENTEEYLDRNGIRPRSARRAPAIAFLDLTGFTTLTEERGDAAAADLASALAVLVQEASRVHGGEVIKWLGDGVMFHFAEPAEGVRCALELVDRAPDAVEVPARVGVNAGPVVFQDGDYFGRTVNVAARIANYARPREVLVSQDVVDAAPPEGVAFELIGDIVLKGLTTPVTLHRALAR
jgi:class 3 adenylate cyclase